VVDEIDTSGRGETHLPAGRQRAELADRLGLDGQVVTAGAEDAQDLLSARIDPCRRTSVVVDKVRPAFGCETLLPASRKRSAASRRRRARTPVRVGRGGGLACLVGGAFARCLSGAFASGTEEIVCGDSCVVPGPLSNLGIGLVGGIDRRLAGRPRPSGRSGVVIDVIGPAEMVDSAFPPLGQRAVLVLSRVEGAGGVASV
jgi:hypothetical protein